MSSPSTGSDVDEPSSEGTKGAIVSVLQFGTHTTAAKAQTWILQKLILKSKDTLGAPQSKQVKIFRGI